MCRPCSGSAYGVLRSLAEATKHSALLTASGDDLNTPKVPLKLLSADRSRTILHSSPLFSVPLFHLS